MLVHSWFKVGLLWTGFLPSSPRPAENHRTPGTRILVPHLAFEGNLSGSATQGTRRVAPGAVFATVATLADGIFVVVAIDIVDAAKECPGLEQHEI